MVENISITALYLSYYLWIVLYTNLIYKSVFQLVVFKSCMNLLTYHESAEVL